VEDRNGRVVLDPEREVRLRQRRMGNDIQVISPQNAYIMTSMMKKTVESGTLAYGAGYGNKFTFRDEKGNRFRMPAAGKTGTPQNWSDAWAVGYTPYYTTAIWFGFDKPGNSLGVNLTGSTLAGPVWGDYMREIHQGLPLKEFAKPATGIREVSVCAKSGLLKTPACNEGEVFLPFLEGTQPVEYCNIHGEGSAYDRRNYGSGNAGTLGLDEEALLGSLRMPVLQIDLPPEAPRDRGAGENASGGRGAANRNRGDTSRRGRNPYLPSNTRQSSARVPPSLDEADPAEPPAGYAAEEEAAPEDPPSAEDAGYRPELPSYNPLLD
jgi:penicillin-binding protein 1A